MIVFAADVMILIWAEFPYSINDFMESSLGYLPVWAKENGLRVNLELVLLASRYKISKFGL